MKQLWVILALAGLGGCASEAPAPARTVSYGLDSSATTTPEAPQARSSATVPPTASPTREPATRIALPPSDLHLRPGQQRTFRSGDGCEVEDRFLDTVACTSASGAGGVFRVWAGWQETSGAWQVRVLIDDDGTLTPAAETVLTGDFEAVHLHPTRVDDVDVVVIEYDLGGPHRRRDYDLVTWESTQDLPAVAASVHGLGGPSLHVDGGTIEITSPNHADGAPMCCPRHVDVTRLERIASVRWEGVVTTRPLASYDSPFSEFPSG